MKRIFFGFEIDASWPEILPRGRIIHEEGRHLTTAFLGFVEEKKINEIYKLIPELPFSVFPTGFFNKTLFLPEKHPRVVAWNIEWFEKKEEIIQFVHNLTLILQNNHFSVSSHQQFLSHVTISRSPFNPSDWKKQSFPLPCAIKSFSLYESIGSLHYEKIWSQNILPPFEEINHTADIGYIVYGKTIEEIHLHSKVALSFQFPEFLNYFSFSKSAMSIEDVIMDLNDLIAIADGEVGCSFKAVSFHNATIKEKENILSWEMIIDV